MIGVLVSNRDLDLPDVLSTELAAYPLSMTGSGTTPLYPDGNMRVQMENPISIKTFNGGVRDIGIIVNVSAVLWTIDCPTKGSVNTLVENFRVSNELTENDVYLQFDRYRNYSTKSITRAVRGITSSLIHRLSIKSPLPPSYYMWPNPKWQPL